MLEVIDHFRDAVDEYDCGDFGVDGELGGGDVNVIIPGFEQVIVRVVFHGVTFRVWRGVVESSRRRAARPLENSDGSSKLRPSIVQKRHS
jgi:hypothetical protein